jgi:hypothetical protein
MAFRRRGPRECVAELGSARRRTATPGSTRWREERADNTWIRRSEPALDPRARPRLAPQAGRSKTSAPTHVTADAAASVYPRAHPPRQPVTGRWAAPTVSAQPHPTPPTVLNLRAWLPITLGLRGVDTLTAVGLCTEFGDFERFAKAEQLMSRAGSETAQDLLLARSGEARTRGRRRKTLALAPVAG